MRDTQLYVFCKQVARLTKTGISLQQGIKMIREDIEEAEIEESYGRELLRKVERQMNNDITFDKALEHTGEFPNQMIQMIRLGMKIDCLEEVLNMQAMYFKNKAKHEKETYNLVGYLVVVASLLWVMMLGVMTHILPVFQEMMMSLDRNIAESMKYFLVSGKYIGNAVIVLLSIIIIGSITFFVCYQRNWYVKIKGIFTSKGHHGQKIATAQLVSMLALLLENGVEMREAMTLCIPLIDHEVIKKKMGVFVELIDGEKSIEDALQESHLFSKVTSHMFSSVEIGQLSRVMNEVGGEYRAIIEEEKDRKIGVIEPIIIGILTIMIAGILLSMMLPLWSMMGSI